MEGGVQGEEDGKVPVSNAADKPTMSWQTPLDLAARTENQLHNASTMAGISEMGNFGYCCHRVSLLVPPWTHALFRA